MLEKYIRFGISPTVLFPESSENPVRHLEAFSKTAALPGYEMFDTSFPDDEGIIKEEMHIAAEEGKGINYNFPIAFQFPGRYNPCSLDEKELDSAIAYAKQHISYAAAAGSRIIAITSGPDYLPEKREMEYASFREYLKALSTECRKYGIEIALETVERHRFKKLLLGPSSEAGSFIREIRQEGYDNVFLMVDTAHCPLMEETPADVLHNSLLAGVNHVHIGNAIVGNEANPMYGHTHPPIGIQDGSYDVDDIAHFLRLLFDCGYLSINPEHDKRPCISYEIRQYPGTSYFSTAMICYEKMDAAFRKAVSS